MKKALIFIRVYWVKLLIAAVILTVLGFVTYGVIIGFQAFGQMEPFSRRMLMGQMALLGIMFLMVHLISAPLTILLQGFMLQGGFAKMFSSNITKAKVNVKWDEIIGMEDAKKEAWELVKLLKDRHMVKSIGGKIIKGTLMLGPPGCGKTYLAKAIATECGLPFLPAVGSEFVGVFVGLGASKMKSLFKQAREFAKLEGGCIIFIDEIDSFARPRMSLSGFGGGMDHNATINQFLTELDGLRQAENNIVVLAATNCNEDDLDSAIMRAGRFDRKIQVTKPNLTERGLLFKFYLSRVKADPAIDTDVLARKTLGFSPSDVDAMVREAGLFALRERTETVSMKHLSEAYDRISFGMKSNITLTKKEKLWTAYHEAGHAVIAYLLHPTNDVIKATIVPRKGMLGSVSQRPAEELHSSNKEQLLANIMVSVASYAAEKKKFGSTSSGVGGGRGSDFDTAIRYARYMVFSLGMGKSGLIGDFNALRPSDISPATLETLNNDVQDILQFCIKEVEQTLNKHHDVFEQFAQELLKKEELEYDEITSIFDGHDIKSGRLLSQQSDMNPEA